MLLKELVWLLFSASLPSGSIRCANKLALNDNTKKTGMTEKLQIKAARLPTVAKNISREISCASFRFHISDRHAWRHRAVSISRCPRQGNTHLRVTPSKRDSFSAHGCAMVSFRSVVKPRESWNHFMFSSPPICLFTISVKRCERSGANKRAWAWANSARLGVYAIWWVMRALKFSIVR